MRRVVEFQAEEPLAVRFAAAAPLVKAVMGAGREICCRY